MNGELIELEFRWGMNSNRTVVVTGSMHSTMGGQVSNNHRSLWRNVPLETTLEEFALGYTIPWKRIQTGKLSNGQGRRRSGNRLDLLHQTLGENP